MTYFRAKSETTTDFLPPPSILSDHLPFHESPGHSDVTHDDHLAVMAGHLKLMIKYAWMNIPEELNQFVNVSFLASCGKMFNPTSKDSFDLH